MVNHGSNNIYSTTILLVRNGDEVVVIGDGQVTFGSTVLKSTAKKVRRLNNDTVVVGFAGATADAFTLFDRLEAKLQAHPKQITRACVELAKDWRTDKYLRKLEAMIIVTDEETSLIVTGNGDVLEPEHSVASIGSGSGHALAAARALIDYPDLSAEDVALKAMKIAASMCIYTNDKFVIEKLKKKS
jgi:ATP-dependent HslUV protease subunit HslV